MCMHGSHVRFQVAPIGFLPSLRGLSTAAAVADLRHRPLVDDLQSRAAAAAEEWTPHQLEGLKGATLSGRWRGIFPLVHERWVGAQREAGRVINWRGT